MSSGKVDLVAIFSPKPGKADRIAELLQGMCDHVEANEPGVLKYQMYKETGKEKGSEDIVMVEIYENMDIHIEHTKTPQFQQIVQTLKDEDLLIKDFVLKYITPIGGFASRG